MELQNDGKLYNEAQTHYWTNRNYGMTRLCNEALQTRYWTKPELQND